MLPMICIMISIFGMNVTSNVFKAAEITSSKPKPAVAPYEYLIAFLAPEWFTMDNMTILVGPGVKVAMVQ
ncbi:hypothetical protein D3C76_1709300 [compost metagenome]